MSVVNVRQQTRMPISPNVPKEEIWLGSMVVAVGQGREGLELEVSDDLGTDGRKNLSAAATPAPIINALDLMFMASPVCLPLPGDRI